MIDRSLLPGSPRPLKNLAVDRVARMLGGRRFGPACATGRLARSCHAARAWWAFTPATAYIPALRCRILPCPTSSAARRAWHMMHPLKHRL